MKEFLKNNYYKMKKNKIINNFIVLLTGEGIISIVSIINLAIIIKAIGLEKNGIIISIQTYCLLLNNIFAFKSFQALIKYITSAIQSGNKKELKLYIYQSYILDICAVIISVVFGFIFLNYYSKFMEWNLSIKNYCKIYLLASLFQIQGTPIGILRAFNKFNFITYNNVLINIIKFVLYAMGLILNLDLEYFIVLEALNFIIPNITLNIFSYKTLKEYNVEKFYKEKLVIDKEFFKFNFYSNISQTIDIPVGQLTTVLINKYLGFEQISVYRIFEKMGSIIGKLGSPLNQIIYPEMAERIAKKDYKSAKKINDKLIKFISILGIGLILIVLFTHKLWLWIFIKDYKFDTVFIFIIYLIFIIFINATSGVHSLFMALNFIKYNIPILLIVNTIYIINLFIVINKLKLFGVILALFIQAIMVVAVKFYIMKKNDYLEKK